MFSLIFRSAKNQLISRSNLKKSSAITKIETRKMSGARVLNKDLARIVDDLSSDSESEGEADFRIDTLVQKAIRPDREGFNFFYP